MSRATRGALLAIVAALLLANPIYVGLFVDPPESRSPTGYAATAVDPANAADRGAILAALGDDEVLDVEELAGENEYSPYGDRYRAPRRAAELLRRAAEDGTSRTDDADAAFTLRRVGAGYRYAAVGDGDSARFFRFSVGARDGATVVTTREVNRSTVAEYVVYSDARLYSSLPGYQRETVEKVIAADEGGYRPYNDEFHEVTDDLLVRNGTYYVFSAAVHADDFGPSARTLVELLLSLLGIVSLVAAAVLTALSYRGGEDAA
jgi:hypothetical protein